MMFDDLSLLCTIKGSASRHIQVLRQQQGCDSKNTLSFLGRDTRFVERKFPSEYSIQARGVQLRDRTRTCMHVLYRFLKECGGDFNEIGYWR